MTTYNCMIDLETLDTRPSAVILSIGAVIFDTDSGKLANARFYKTVSVDDQLASGRTISASTLAWWAKQDKAVYQEALTGGTPLVSALTELKSYMAQAGKDVKPWSHGASFDIAMLDHAFAAAGMESPWKFWNIRDTRTLLGLLPPPPIERRGDHHNALDDAVYQAECICWCHQQIRR